ncbi:MAG TPA: hypothetical protein VEJ84_08725, partial [Acidimicrobiales bacterium]|nr:hypothetical protein [Acidimicrobiales bacterium]
CGGALVMPGDVMVGDANGALVVPAQLAEEVALDALEQEQREAWALERVRAGESVRGVYPLSEARRGDYEAWRTAQTAETGETKRGAPPGPEAPPGLEAPAPEAPAQASTAQASTAQASAATSGPSTRP